MISERSAFSKVRAKIRREIDAAEEAEHESGELNLIPFLDIITNTVIFLLATTASVVAMANININAPKYSDPSAYADTQPDTPEKPPLNLTVTISFTGFIVAGSGAVLPGPDGKLPTVKCKLPLRSKRCPAYLTTRMTADGKPTPVWVNGYNYKALKKKVYDIKKQYSHERQVILLADRSIPYQLVVATMDVLRGKPTTKCTGQDGCMFDQVVLSAGLQ